MVNVLAGGPRSTIRHPARNRWRRIAAAQPISAVLMYHRIAEPATDTWDLAVSPENFTAQLEVLTRIGPCGTFAGIHAALIGATPHRRSFAITFDDGYRDNLLAGLPALRKAGVPATVFVASGLTGSGREFWWDALARVFLQSPRLPGRLRLRLDGVWHDWVLGPAPGRARRLRTIHAVRAALMRLEPAAIEPAAAEICAWAGVDRAGSPVNHPMDLDELREMAASGQIEIGGHTRGHAALTLVAPHAASAEIANGRADLRERTGQPVTSFAFPYGLHDDHGVAAVRAAGFSRSCTVEPGLATASTDPFRVPRIQVRNWTPEVFEREIIAFIGRRTGRG